MPFTFRPTDLKPVANVPYALIWSETRYATVICPRRVRVAHIRLVRLRREDRSLQRNQRRIVGLQSAVDLLIEVHLLLVVVDADARQHAQTIDHAPLSLAEHRGARVRVGDGLVVAVPIEQPGRRRVRARREQKRRGSRSLLLLERRIGIDRLMEAEYANDKVQRLRHRGGVPDFLRPLALRRGGS
jgi:hypothetical protein